MDIKQEMSLASIELVRSFPFYGHILVQMEKVIEKSESARVKTMGVGKRSKDEMLIKLFVHSKFIDDIYAGTDKRTAFINVIEILKHEVLHVIFGHLALTLPDITRRQIACDLAVNSYLDRNKLPKPTAKPKTKEESMLVGSDPEAGVFPSDYGFEPKKGAIWYYNALFKNDKYQKQCASGCFGTEGMMSSVIDSHKLWEIAQDDPMLKEMLKDLVRKSQRICQETKKWGDIPGGILDDLDLLTKHDKPALPWQQVLRIFVASAMESNLEYTMKRRSRRFGTRPGTRKEDVLNLAIGIDTSGSIADEQLHMFFKELYWIEKNGASITVFECDTTIQREYPFRQFDGKAKGRGGTDLEPVLKEVEQRRFDGLIFFTDFYTPPINKRYNIPSLWILSNCSYSKEEYPYKYGRYIHIDGDMNVRVG